MRHNCVYHNNDMVQFITYGPYIPEKKANYERVFSVSKDWLMVYLKRINIPMERFLDTCTMDETLNTYVSAASEGQLIEVNVV